MASRTGSRLCLPLLFLLCSLHISLTPARLLKDCTVVYSNNVTDGVSVDCEERDLDSMPEGIPADATSMSLKSNRIRKINRTDFHHLSNLRYLNLSKNAIDHVDDGAFDHLTELEVLRMDCNQLTTLTDRMFQGLSNLLQLSLEDNHIAFFNPAAFRFLPSLQELSLTSNNITDIIPVLQLPRLQVLVISIEAYESFQSKDLPLNTSSELRELRVISSSINLFSITTAAFPHLETIDLFLCCADIYGWEWDIPDKYFLSNVTKVYFSDNNMSFKSIGKALQSLNSLEYLELWEVFMFMDILDIVIIACNNMPTLSTLILRHNRIESLDAELSSCTRLSDLDLSDNSLSYLSNGSLTQMTHMSRLNLARNDLSKVPGDIKHLSMLRMLNLAHNFISDLSCSDFSDLTKLTHLHLDDNQISALKQCVFEHLGELKSLTVSRNLIRTFGDTFWAGLQKLELLDLNNNIVSGLRVGDLSRLKSLKHLDVELDSEYFAVEYLEGLEELETFSLKMINFPNKVTSSPSPEFLLPSLKVFSVQFILLTVRFDFDYFSYSVLRYMPHLEQLMVEHANIDTPIRKTFDTVPQLKTLTLRSDTLSHLYAEMFEPIPNLEALDLSDNKLKSLDFLVRANLTRVSRLDLSRNELTVVNASVFRFLPALRYVNMSGNPFTCDCSNVDFQQWMLSNNQTLVVAAQDYTCAYPLAEKGSRFLDFDYKSCWVDASFVYYISSTCVIALTLLTSLTYHFLRLHLLYGYYLFLAFLYDAKESKKGSPQRYDAFISYNVHDELWVYREMLPVLEGEQGWRLCLHHRDFMPGAPIIENITDAIYSSRKIICVISHHYLESEWCSREMQIASYRLFDEQKDVLILVFLEDIPAHQLSPYYQMRRLVKRHTYLSWSRAGQHPGLFWQNLRRALDTPRTDLGLNE